VLGRRSVLAVLVASIAGLVIQANAAEENSIKVFAAASMKNALDEVNTQFTNRSGIKVRRQLCGKLGIDEADRAGRPRRRVSFG
jgi:ABC-type molybdate transport system substrate-binding protein